MLRRLQDDHNFGDCLSYIEWSQGHPGYLIFIFDIKGEENTGVYQWWNGCLICSIKIIPITTIGQLTTQSN